MSRVSYNNYGRPYYGRVAGAVGIPTFRSLSDIDKVLNGINKSIETKGYATLSDFYKLTDGTVIEGDSDYGWFNVLDVSIRVTRYGYELVMPMSVRVCSDPVRDAFDRLKDADEDNALDIIDEVKDHLRTALK